MEKDAGRGTAYNLREAQWTDADTDAMFAVLGRYFIIFQSLEGKLDQILLLGWGHENWTASQAKLARMRNAEKIDAVHHLVLSSPDFARVHTRPEWCSDFEHIIQHLHEERDYRNALAHSQYLFDFVKIGYPPLRSLRNKGADKRRFDQEYLTKETQDELLRRVTELAVKVGWVHLQLVHDYKASAVPTGEESL